MKSILKQTRSLIADFDRYLDSIEEASLMLPQALKDFFHDRDQEFTRRMENLTDLEKKADETRRNIRYKLYTKMLIPESRGDVLSILENIDKVIDSIKHSAMRIHIERPVIPEYLREGLLDLTEAARLSVDYTVRASKAYLNKPEQVQDYLNKIRFYEHEADTLEQNLRKAVFTSDEKRLSAKMQLSGIIEDISSIADVAEDVSDRISVAAIKREF